LRMELLRHLNSLSADFYDKTPMGEIVYSLREPIEEIAYFCLGSRSRHFAHVADHELYAGDNARAKPSIDRARRSVHPSISHDQAALPKKAHRAF
jgi:hypothetical protein